MRIRPLPSLDRIREVVSYDKEIGELFWRVRRGPRKAGDIAGGVNVNGYRVLRIDGFGYMAHRIIWALESGHDTIKPIDHIDGDPLNNRISNLRVATHSQNMCNSKLRSDNSSGIKGICFDARSRKWRAVIMIDQKYISVGHFADKLDAIEALDAARKQYHGEFARAA